MTNAEISWERRIAGLEKLTQKSKTLFFLEAFEFIVSITKDTQEGQEVIQEVLHWANKNSKATIRSGDVVKALRGHSHWEEKCFTATMTEIQEAFDEHRPIEGCLQSKNFR